MLLISYLLLTIAVLYSTANPKKHCVTDLGFLLDQSSSINMGSGSNFLKVLQFIKEAAKKYGISKVGVKAGVLVFSDDNDSKTKVTIHFNKCSDTKCFVNEVNKIHHQGGDTYTNAALKKAKDELFNTKNGYRGTVTAFAILIADGKQTGGVDEEQDARDAADALKAKGVIIIAFGIRIGKDQEARDLLTDLASPGEYYDVSDFSDLHQHLDKLMIKVCEAVLPTPKPTKETTPTTIPETTPTTVQETTPTTVQETTPTTVPETTPTTVPETTPTTVLETTPATIRVPTPRPGREKCEPAILGFILDTSSTTKTLHDREIKIIKGIVHRFDVRDGYSQAGLVTFDDNAITRAAIGQIRQGDLFNEMLDTIPHTGGRSFIDKGLRETTKVMYGSDFPSRLHGIRKLLFVITDGHQTENYRGSVDLRKESELLRRQNVKTIAVAMGRRPNYFYLDQLVPLGERSKNIVEAKRKSVESVVEDAVRQSCWRRFQEGISTADSCDVSVGFVLDASGTTGTTFEQEKFALLEVAEQFNLGLFGTQAAVTSFSDYSRIDIPFIGGRKISFAAFETAVENLRHHGGRTKIDRGLEAIKLAFRNHTVGLSNKKILVVITDGLQSDMNLKPVIDAAESLRRNGFIIHTITIRRKKATKRKVRQFLARLSGSSERNWYIPAWSGGVQNLKWQSLATSAVSKLVGDVCETRK